MPKSYDYFVARRVAKLRHTKTSYEKHYDLMYDENGNPTALRHHINEVLGKIAKGELDYRYLGGVQSEIKLAQRAVDKQKRLEKIAKNKSKKGKGKTFLSIAEQQAALLRGVQKLNDGEYKWSGMQYKWLGVIGMRPHQIHKKSKKLLTYNGE